MAYIQSERPYVASVHHPAVVWQLLIAGHPVVPSGPYFNDSEEAARSICDDECLSKTMADARAHYAPDVELSGIIKNILRYVCAGLIKHCGFGLVCDDFKSEMHVRIGNEALDMQARELIDELYRTRTFSPNHKRWIELEQAQSIEVVRRYSEVLEWACQANEELCQIIKAEVQVACEDGPPCLAVLLVLEVQLMEDFIDLSALGRRTAVILNTVLLRFVRPEEQRQLFRAVHNIVRSAIVEAEAEEQKLEESKQVTIK